MIIWDKKKNSKLIKERNISFEQIADKIFKNDIIEILKNPSRERQKLFVIYLNDYTYAVPFITDKDNNIVLKTAYPSRKLHEKYKELKYES